MQRKDATPKQISTIGTVIKLADQWMRPYPALELS